MSHKSSGGAKLNKYGYPAGTGVPHVVKDTKSKGGHDVEVTYEWNGKKYDIPNYGYFYWEETEVQKSLLKLMKTTGFYLCGHFFKNGNGTFLSNIVSVIGKDAKGTIPLSVPDFTLNIGDYDYDFVGWMIPSAHNGVSALTFTAPGTTNTSVFPTITAW